MKKLVAYLVAGMPSSDFSIDLGLALLENGVDILEMGMPFSDPIADGAVIQQVSEYALKNGIHFKDFLHITETIAQNKSKKPFEIYAMGYLNPFYTYGIENLAQWASLAKIDGFIIPDLPYEELEIIHSKRKLLNTITFISPTTTKERMSKILKNAYGFIYLVAYTGITGSNKRENLSEICNNIREISTLPLYLGFGIDKHNAKSQSKDVDGVIVGSAFVKILLQDLTNKEKINRICDLASSIKEKINS